MLAAMFANRGRGPLIGNRGRNERRNLVTLVGFVRGSWPIGRGNPFRGRRLLFAEVPGRFETAIDYLDDYGYKNITIVGHSMGASMATYYLSLSEANAVDSLVIIGTGVGPAISRNVEALAKLRVSTLDLYGSNDLEPVLNTVEQRATAGNKQSGHRYLQVRVDGANHFFQGHEEALVQRVIDWIEAQRD